MKKFIPLFLLLILTSCTAKNMQPAITKNSDGSYKINQIDIEKNAVQTGKKVDGYKDVTIITGKKVTKPNLVTIDLNKFANKEVQIDFSCDMKISDSTSDVDKIVWMINEVSANFPVLFEKKLKTGEWHTVRGSVFVSLGEKRQLYLSGAGLSKDNITIYIKNLSVKISGDELDEEEQPEVEWTDAPPVKDALLKHFDYFGLTTGWQGSFSDANIRNGLAHHASSYSTENEFKPDFLWAWQAPSQFTDFVAEDGKTYKMPNKISMGAASKILTAAKDAGLQMRGHVLVWHNQTPKFFFREGWKDDGDYVSREEMTARQEWYIKYVLDWVRNWEEKNNDGKHIITTWDVVNEAASDNPNSTVYSRPNGDWYGIYKDASYIANAFRFANKYAPKDVKLCYNDYSSAAGANLTNPTGKHAAILRIVDDIQSDPEARIDVVGMQSHISTNTNVAEYDAAIQNFVKKGVNVQITELDIGCPGKYNSTKTSAKYKEFFEMLIKNKKTADKHGVEGVTIWGIADENTWLNGQPEYKNNKQHPLLFKYGKGGKSKIVVKKEYQAVIDAANDN